MLTHRQYFIELPVEFLLEYENSVERGTDFHIYYENPIWNTVDFHIFSLHAPKIV